MRSGFKNTGWLFLLLFFCNCKTPYNPTPITTVTNYLVVEGFINITDSTYVNLSRTVTLNSSITKPELKATVTIENNTGTSYPLKELGNGVYASAPLNLSAANQYHLRIKTSTGNQYVSDFVPAKISPPIDSITWAPKTNGLEIYANTHDPNNATHYYRWDFTEEWEFHSNYNSAYISNGLQVVPRTPSQQIWDCFTGDVSSSISVGTSAQLGKDVISQQVINTIPSTAEKISVKYSTFVKQYALTKEAYDYWSLLKKNTEQLGSIFDAQPSASIGNIHGVTNPAEVVIGYISAGTVTTNRIFIAKSQLPNWRTIPFYPNCASDSIFLVSPPAPNAKPTEDQILNYKSVSFESTLSQQIPIIDFGPPAGYISAAPICVDCTLRGKVAPPPYWK